MMKLSSMRKTVVSCVDPSTGDSDLARFLSSRWVTGIEWMKYHRSSANHVFFFRTEDRDLVIRFCKTDEKPFEEIHGEMELLIYLSNHGISVARPIPSLNGRYIETTTTQFGDFHSVVFERALGDHRDIDTLDLGGFETWGDSLGRLHDRLKEIPLGTFHRRSHPEVLEDLVSDSPPTTDPEKHELAYVRKVLAKLPHDPDEFGMVHHDYELDNLMWSDAGLIAIDFDDAVYSWYVDDIASALGDLFDDGRSIDTKDARFKAFVKGYRRWTDISDHTLDRLADFYRIDNYIGYKKLERAVDIPPDDEYPDWKALVAKLKWHMDQYVR